jgi:putative alpha-1,2-mannosidase
MERLLLAYWLFFAPCTNSVSAQSLKGNDPASYVNPLIGTGSSDVKTLWGNDGGTYPGAVAPSGFVQITPETNMSEPHGYHYKDSTIFFFSTIDHFSGYPEGSSGNIKIMPVDDIKKFQIGKYNRPFQHENEKAEPGYYKVLFHDNHTLVEATATERCGEMKFTFPSNVDPHIFVGDIGEITYPSNRVVLGTKYHSVISLDESIMYKKIVEGGVILSFQKSNSSPRVITLKLSVSTVGFQSSNLNIEKEIDTLRFDQIKILAREKWNKELSVVEIEDSNIKNKTIFYTALYHSLLMPWIISDVAGNYIGQDGKKHKAKGKKQYGGFSPWDTFRSLHPLLSLLAPDKQFDIALSMLDIFQQTGHLPVDPMTGNHAVAIIADTYFKGISKLDSSLAYNAMLHSIVKPPFIQHDIETYQKMGYVPFLFSESVTRTVEYAYDDWVLSQFAKEIMHSDSDYLPLIHRSYQYRNLFNPQELFLLPRNENEFKMNPGTVGYKEGNKWNYSFFVPHHPKDLINLMGGDSSFSSRLDSAFINDLIVFDNETNFHIPYFFNYSNSPSKTQKWTRTIMKNRFNDTPGGIPGNDDLGSMSSWFVFNAMGFYPVCPGRPFYDLSSPLFKQITIHLQDGKQFTITTSGSRESFYIQSIKNHEGNEVNSLQIPHSFITKGGGISFELCDTSNSQWNLSKKKCYFPETQESSKFKILDYIVSKRQVEPNELFWVKFTIANQGSLGTKIIRLWINGKEYAQKNCLVASNSIYNDSLSCRLYSIGKVSISLDEQKKSIIEVLKPLQNLTDRFEIKHININHIIEKGKSQSYSFSIKNIGGVTDTAFVNTFLDQDQIRTEKISLLPGEKKNVTHLLSIDQSGIHTIKINSKEEKVKVYCNAKNANILDISCVKENENTSLTDHSGFHNHGKIIHHEEKWKKEKENLLKFGDNCFVSIADSEGFESIEKALTMMAWVYPTEKSINTVDIFTQGDFNVIQTTDNKTLTFFAGGWGRGTCSIKLPNHWNNSWHHVTGVCNDDHLKIFIDGKLEGEATVQKIPNLSFSGKWNIGRNEEFPSERIFHGYIHNAKLFVAPLGDQEINEIVNRERPSLIKTLQ